MKKIFALVLAVFAFSWSHVVYSQTSTYKSYEVFRTKLTTFGNHTTSFATNGQPLVGSVLPIWSPLPGGGSSVVVPSNVTIGKAVANVSVKGFVNGASVVGALRGLVGGPAGAAVGVGVMLLPVVADWLLDGGVRPAQGPNAPGSPGNPSGLPFEVRDPSVCTVAPCYEYASWSQISGVQTAWHPSIAAACAQLASLAGSKFSSCTSTMYNGYAVPYAKYNNGGGDIGERRLTTPKASSWLPASMDDIAPYMTPRPTPPAVIDGLINAGASIPVTPESITGPAKVTHADSEFNTVILPLPSTTQTETFTGQPVFIGDGKIGNGYRDVRVEGVPQFQGGSMSSQLQGTVVSIPTNTTTSSVYNPATNTTTVTTTTNYPGATVSQKVSSETNLTYKPGSEASVDGTTKTTVTTTVKDANGQTISTKTTTDTTSEAKPDKETDPCKQNPDVIGCAKLGEAPKADPLPQKTVPVSWSPVSFASPASCPAPYTGTIAVLSFSKTWSFGFDAMCGLMASLRALFLAIGAATAAYVFMEGLKA